MLIIGVFLIFFFTNVDFTKLLQVLLPLKRLENPFSILKKEKKNLTKRPLTLIKFIILFLGY